MSRFRLAATLAYALSLSLAVAGTALAQAPSAPGAAQPKQAEPMPPPSGGAAVPSPLLPGDAVGGGVSLPARTVVYIKGHTNWDAAFDTLLEAFKSLQEYLDKQGIKPNGPAMTIYTETDDTGFGFRAAFPIAEAPKDPPKGDIAIDKAPAGKALKFVHRGSYDALDTTYEAITNYLDDKRLEAKDLFIEEYTTNPITANPDKLVVHVFVPVK